MNIQLPEDLVQSVDDEVQKGHFASKDDLVAAAVREFLHQRRQQMPPPEPREFPPDYKPIWEIADEIYRSLPEEEWAKLPTDGSEQLDHYIYGSPKRRTS